MGYVFADILSTYVFTRMMYTDVSDTFAKVKQYLAGKKRPVESPRMSEIEMTELMRALAEALAANASVEETPNNALVPMDEEFLSSVRPDIVYASE
jgi:hypothetical protein